MSTEFTAYLIQGLWVFWALCWLAASWRNKKPQTKEAVASRLRYQLVVAIGVCHVFLGLPTFDAANAELFARTPGYHFITTEMCAAGLGWSLYARWHLGRNWSGTVQLKKDHKLIRSGPYRYTRHPIYTGLLFAFAGLVLFLDRWQGVAGFALIVIGFRMKIAREERFMHQKFGRVYELYSEAVPMLVPRLQ